MSQSNAFQIEFPLVPTNPDRFANLLNSKGLLDYVFGEKRTVLYADTFWDTRHADLYSSARTLRTRRRSGQIEFLDYKGPPKYLVQYLFARPFVSEPVKGTDDAISAIQGKRPSEAIQQLYMDRPDLIGRPLLEVATCHVERINFDLVTEHKKTACTISAHVYYYSVGGIETEKFHLIEVQPAKDPSFTDRYDRMIEGVTSALANDGWYLSPTSKYHRIERSLIDAKLSA